jgi:hypothetical protein
VTHPQDEQGVLVGQVDKLGDGGSLMVDLLLEELFPGGACSYAGSQHAEAIGADVLEGKLLALGRVEADGWLPLVKESQCLLKCQDHLPSPSLRLTPVASADDDKSFAYPSLLLFSAEPPCGLLQPVVG